MAAEASRPGRIAHMSTSVRRTALVAALAALGVGGTAHATTTIGSDLTAAPDIGLAIDGAGTQLVQPPGAPFPIVTPTGGVLTQIRLRYGATRATPGTVAFRILGGTNPYAARPASVDGGELRFPLPANVPNGFRGFVEYRPVDANGRPIGISIAAGERLGLAQRSPVADQADVVASVAGGVVGTVDLTQALSGSLVFRSSGRPSELLVQGVVEPDADGDRRGDETQDQCPVLPNDPATGRCPPRFVTRTVRVEVPVERCRVPLLRGLTRRFAARLLGASGCSLGVVRTRLVRRGRRGRVIGQTTRANAVLAGGASVGITLSRRATRRKG
jgi:hypothetical protein